MTVFQEIRWTEKFEGKWYISTALGVSGTFETKKKALNEALKEADRVAKFDDELVLTDVYTKSGKYQRTEKTSPN